MTGDNVTISVTVGATQYSIVLPLTVTALPPPQQVLGSVDIASRITVAGQG